MAKVFVSYSRKDITFAKRLTAELQKGDLDFWIDWEGIPPTVDWWKEIEKGIEETDIFLFLISPDSAKSKVCGQEIETAVRNGKRIIPVVVRDIIWEDTPKHLGHLNYIFIRENDDFDGAVKKLITAIQTDYEWAATHRRLQVKALDWERNGKDNGFLLRGMDLQDAELDLATNTSKNPHPTDLQREYVFASRRASDRQRRNLTWVSIATAIALAGLAAFGFFQANVAKEEARKAIARQFAAQAQSVYASRGSEQMIASLLAIQSMKVFHTSDAASFLLNNNHSANLISSMSHKGGVSVVAFSPDGKYILSTGCDKFNENGLCLQESAYIVTTSSGEEVTSVTYEGFIHSAAFSPNGKYVAVGGCDKLAADQRCIQGTARVWEVSTAKELSSTTHAGVVRSLAFSPDGKYVASGGCDKLDDNNSCAEGSARIWDASGGKELAHLIHHDDVWSVAFSPDGKYLASGGSSLDHTAHVWEVGTEHEKAHVIHDSLVSSIAFSPDGKYVVSGSWDGTARVWEALTESEVARITHATYSYVNSVAFSSDGKYVASAGTDFTARILDLTTRQEVARVTHDGQVTSVAFSPDGKFVLSAGGDATARVWEAATGKEVARMTHGRDVSSAAFSPDGKYVISGGCDKYANSTCILGTARVWEAARSLELANVDHKINSAIFSPDAKELAYAMCDNLDVDNDVCLKASIQVLETSTGREVANIPNALEVNAIAFSPEGEKIVSGGCEEYDSDYLCQKGIASIWEVATGKKLFDLPHPDKVHSVAFSPEGKYVVTGSRDGMARLWDALTGEKLFHMSHDYPVLSVAFTPDGQFVFSQSDDVYVNIWEITTGHKIRSIEHSGITRVTSTALSHSDGGKHFVLGERDGTVSVWETATGKEIMHRTHVPDAEVHAVAFSRDGKYVVSGGFDGTVRVWEVATGNEIARMTYDSSVRSVGFSPDGKYVVSGVCEKSENNQCAIGSARVWEMATRKELARMIHNGMVFSVAFSSDSKYVISISNDVHVWEWQTQDIISNACKVMSRNLTLAEWDQYVGDALTYPKEQKDATCPELPLDSQGPIDSTNIP